MGIFRSMAGIVETELTSADIPGTLAAIAEQNITVFLAKPISDLTTELKIYRKDYRKLVKLCQRRGDKLRLRRRSGLYWTGKGVLKRPVLLVGMLCLLGIVLFLPTRIYFVRVEGNVRIPANQIIAAAEESGICFGASRREVRSERMKNTLLEELPELQWAGVNTSGCVAIISVRERSAPEKNEEPSGVSSIVAACDGIIISSTVTRGNGLCQPGQAVIAGQVLISGYTDCGLCIQATRAEGEVFAQTQRKLTAVTPVSSQQRVSAQKKEVKYSILVGKKRINLWKGSGIWDSSCGRMYEEYYITLPGDFQLPIAIVKETVTIYETDVVTVEPETAEKVLAEFAQGYLLGQMVAGNILDQHTELHQSDEVYCLNGTYICTEMIGRVRQEEIGEYHGKND